MANKTVIVNGGNLFAIASQYLGDATQWNRIAIASGTGPDPFLPTGPATTLIIPVYDLSQTGGIVTSPIANNYPAVQVLPLALNEIPLDEFALDDALG